MTRKDYELIAAAVANAAAEHRQSFGERWPLDGATVVGNLADALATTNPRFDRGRFIKACGL